jgi:lysozyme
MISRRNLLSALAASTAAGCTTTSRAPLAPSSYPVAPPPPDRASLGLDAVIDISRFVTVTDFRAVRQSNILGVIHKATEGGDYVDPLCAARRPQAEAAGLLWGAYHFGTRQYTGARQAQTFLAAARPRPDTLIALDFEANDPNPRNTMTLAQAEAFVQAVYQSTGRLPLVYTHPTWADGAPSGRGRVRLSGPISSNSILAQCDLWLADYREEPQLPSAWAAKGWRLWQYAGNETEADSAYGSVPRAVAGVSHCDRNLFAGDTTALYKFWNGSDRTA